jgi:2-polyprenyl-6-methoxyphenol hydroxylase-like FAD-dependent oxidoreductase
MAEQFDVIIVGARCAGSPLATLLARAGLKVCVLDRARFPSDTPSTHAVQPSGVTILDHLGVLEPLLKVSPPITRGTIAFSSARIELDDFTQLVGAPMLGTRRVTLDALLLEAAAAAGAKVRTQTAVTGLVEDRGRVAGVKTKSGELRAPLVVGADGVNSAVARLVGAATYHQTPAGRLFAWAYFEGAAADDDHLWLGNIGDHGFLAFPTDSDLFMAAVVPSLDRRDEVLGDREAIHATELARWPELEAALAGAKRVGPVRVMSRDGFFRQSAGPGWVLVGDAGHFKDPTPGQGISDALRQAVKLASVVEKALGGEGAADRALHDWWSWRDREAWEMYWLAHDMGASGPAPLLVQELQRRIAADRQLTDTFLRVLNHDFAPSMLFTPSLALAATFRALLTHTGQRRVLLREARTLAANNWRRRAPSHPSPAARQRRGVRRLRLPGVDRPWESLTPEPQPTVDRRTAPG